MKLKMNTEFMPFIDVCIYWGNLRDIYEDIDPEYDEDFKDAICESAEETINEMLRDIEDIIGMCEISDVSFHSPREYNFGGDWLEFEMEVSDDITTRIYTDYKKNTAEFLEFAKQHFGSHSGFISFMPYTKEKFEFAMKSGKDLDRAAGMYFYYLESKEDMEMYQRDFVDSVSEKVAQNGWDVRNEE